MKPANESWHPEAELLRRFALGLLHAEEQDGIERHLAACDACCRAALIVPDDRLTTLLWRESPLPAAGIMAGQRLVCLALAAAFAIGGGACSPSPTVVKAPPGVAKPRAHLHSEKGK